VRPRGLGVRASPVPPAPADGAPRPAASPSLRRVAPPPEDINPKHTFASFVVGPSNQLAHAAAVAAAGGGGRRYNPLFICGGTGLGKTHLMHAIAHPVPEEGPRERHHHLSARPVTNEL